MADSPHGEDRCLRVLIVEDDPGLRRLIDISLAPYTKDVTLAANGSAALAALGAGEFDVVASDISLPDVSGLEIISRARELAPSAGIVAMTGYIEVDMAVRAMKAGADDFLGKPFDGDILWHMLNKAADSRSQRVEAEQARTYRHLAYTDALTGCPNRRFIDEVIVEAVARAKDSGEPLTVAYADIDNFKLLNDFIGHQHGDELLKQVAEALSDCVTRPAAYARFGGDEFVAVFPGMLPEAVRAVMDRVRRRVSSVDMVNSGKTALPTRLSVGIAQFRGYETPRDLVGEAEDHMYLDKTISPTLLVSGAEASPEALQKITNLKSLRNLVKAIDRRDSYTRFHSDHATHFALQFARPLNLPEEELNAITIGGPIHDLGKIVVPDEILRKPGPLNTQERRTMEEHPAIGAAIVSAVTDYDTVVNLVRHHHERFDGHGYPGGLKRLEISLPTRIFTLADAYSAMTTDRPYRKGLSVEKAISEIVAGRGTQFDPDLATSFVEMLERNAALAAA